MAEGGVSLRVKKNGSMNSLSEYRATDRMRDLIGDNSALLMVMSRFGISLGFGDKCVREICEEQGVDTPTFLAVANFGRGRSVDLSTLSLATLIDYLQRAHTYFLDFNLPAIRRKLIEAIDYASRSDVALLLVKFYDEYVTEVRRHMEYENTTVFAYVGQLLQGRLDRRYTIAAFAEKHNAIGPKLRELKELIIRYYPGRENNLLNAVLFDLINCEQDLTSHCRVEDQLFVPAVELLEDSLRRQGDSVFAEEPATVPAPAADAETLSQREREIIACVAKGMTNKTIADRLCLSIHTVTTHRRNITVKLQIHTAAGLTIYAIVHKLVSLQEIEAAM